MTGGYNNMTITLTPDIEQAIAEKANQQGIAAETIVLEALRVQFVLPKNSSNVPIAAQDEWEKRILGLGMDCKVSLPHEAVSSEGLYE